MKTWFASSVTRLGHLSDETIAKLISGELSSYREFRVSAHLNKCWQCKARREALEKASFQVVEYRKLHLGRCLPLNPRRRQEFFKRLDEVWEETTVPSWRSRLIAHFRVPPAPSMNPVYASTFVVAIAVVLLFFIWHRNPPTMLSRTFLAKAAQAEAQQQSTATVGVIYQKVEIRAGSMMVEHTIYRDAARKRKPRVVALKPDERALQTEMARGGVDWDQPLSVHDYVNWHEGQSLVHDEVRPYGQGLLTLTSTVPSGPVAAESLTVRLADFHPVQRTVAMRNSDTIEIAEVHYDVLGWDAVNDGLFEPLSRVPVVPALASALPSLISPEQLDLAELQARLVLNSLHADSTEQLEFLRSRSAVEVKGLVGDEVRKKQLVTALRAVPHVVPAFFTVDDLNAHRTDADAASSVQAYSAMAGESPLERFLHAQGKGTDDLNEISQKLLDAALSMKQEGSAIDELQQRFGNEERLDDASRQVLRQLLKAHVARLIASADAEDALLVRVIGVRSPDVGPLSDSTPLVVEASVPFNLCEELISGDNSPQRDVPALTNELFKSTQSVRTSARKILDRNSVPPRIDSPSSYQR